MKKIIIPRLIRKEAFPQKSDRFTIVLISLYNIESYSIRTLHIILKNAGFNVTSLFFKRREKNNTYNKYSSLEIDHLISQIKRLNPSIVGISLMSTFFDLAAEITKKIREQIDTLILWGGIHPTIRPDQCLNIADIVCIGEGEGPILELVEKFSKGEEISNIRNLWIKNNQTIIKNELRPLIQDLDSIPYPDYSSDDKYIIDGDSTFPCNYNDTIQYLGGINFMTSRGCPFACTYCANSILRNIYQNKGKYIRQRSVDNVIRELEYLKENYDLRFIRFEDDVFTINDEWLKEFRLKYKKSVGLPFSCYGHAGYTTEEVLRLLKDTGCTWVQIGIQSGSERIKHDYFRRNDTNQEVIRLAQTLYKLGIRYGCDILMENPLETERDRRETLSLLLRLPKPFFLNTHTLTNFPEYELTKSLLKNKLISERDVEDIRKESFEHNRWNPYLDFKRDKINMFWNCIYFLASITSILPEQFIINLSHARILKENPAFFLRTILLLTAGFNRIKVKRISHYIMYPLEILVMLRRKWINILVKVKMFIYKRSVYHML